MGGSYSIPERQNKYYDDYLAKMASQEGKTVVITGTTTGLGMAAAKAFVSKGAWVIMLNRPSGRATAAVDALKKDGEHTGKVSHVDCDLQSFASVKTAADEVLKLTASEGVDVLANNAGVMAMPDQATPDGYDVQMQTNHLSHFLLAAKLLPALEKAAQLRGEARVVNHSSGARLGNPLAPEYLGKNSGSLGGDSGRWERYHQTKLANMVFTYALQEKLDERNADNKIKCAVGHPGLAASNLQKTTADAGGGFGLNVLMTMSQSAEDGALPFLHCMWSPEVEKGSFFMPANRGILGTLMGDGITGPPAAKKPEPNCNAEDAKKMLWEESEKAVGKFFA